MRTTNNSRTLARQVADMVRQEILAGRLRDGEVLPQVALARRLGVSTIPLREALKTLETEGFITFHSFQGAFVAPLTVRELSELGRIHTALEVEALHQGVRKMKPDSLDQAEQLALLIPEENDSLKRYQLGMAYLEAMYRDLDMPLLFGMIKQVSNRTQRYMPAYIELSQQFPQPAVSRLDVITACRAQDSERAKAAFTEFMLRHIGYLVYYASEWQKPPLQPKKPQRARRPREQLAIAAAPDA